MNINAPQPPHNDEAEQAVLGSLLIDGDMFYEVSDTLDAGMFYRPAHRWIYEAIERLHGRQEPFDVIPMESELRAMGKAEAAGGIPYLIDLINGVATSLHAPYYARIVAEAATRRRLLDAAGRIAKAAYDDEKAISDTIAAAEAEVMAAISNRESAVKSARRLMSDYIDEFMSDVTATDSPRIVKTGLIDLDNLLGGLERGHQYIVAGSTSMGKSGFALGVALDAAKAGKRVMVFSLEMNSEQLNNRFISNMTGIPAGKLKKAARRYLTTEQQAAVMRAGAELSELALFLDDTPALKPSDIQSRASRVYAEHGLDLVIVDHMHIMQANNPTGKQVDDLGAIAMDLATAYKRLNVAGITLAQLNREVGKRLVKIPVLADLRESGKIEENAYVVMFLHRPAYYDPETEDPNVAKVVVAKNRDGATGSVGLFWHGELATFKNLDHTDLNPPKPPAKSNGHTRTTAKELHATQEIIL